MVNCPTGPLLAMQGLDSDDEAALVHAGGTFWRSTKQPKPISSCRLGVAERRQPRIGDRYQACVVGGQVAVA